MCNTTFFLLTPLLCWLIFSFYSKCFSSGPCCLRTISSSSRCERGGWVSWSRDLHVLPPLNIHGSASQVSNAARCNLVPSPSCLCCCVCHEGHSCFYFNSSVKAGVFKGLLWTQTLVHNPKSTHLSFNLCFFCCVDIFQNYGMFWKIWPLPVFTSLTLAFNFKTHKNLNLHPFLKFGIKVNMQF